jgi:hypothetical protein
MKEPLSLMNNSWNKLYKSLQDSEEEILLNWIGKIYKIKFDIRETIFYVWKQGKNEKHELFE